MISVSGPWVGPAARHTRDSALQLAWASCDDVVREAVVTAGVDSDSDSGSEGDTRVPGYWSKVITPEGSGVHLCLLLAWSMS